MTGRYDDVTQGSLLAHLRRRSLVKLRRRRRTLPKNVLRVTL